MKKHATNAVQARPIDAATTSGSETEERRKHGVSKRRAAGYTTIGRRILHDNSGSQLVVRTFIHHWANPDTRSMTIIRSQGNDDHGAGDTVSEIPKNFINLSAHTGSSSDSLPCVWIVF